MRTELIPELLVHYRAALGHRLVALASFGSRARGDARPDSDLDLLLISEGLDDDLFERASTVRASRLRQDDPAISVRALTPREYERDIAPIDFDIALDARLHYDRDDYLAGRLGIIRQRIAEAGLVRGPDLTWTWKRWPARRDWAVTWDGVRI
jgi:predicted nucleotidyltransferase